jgi:cytochrome c-type biogenesis protein CcmF
MEYIGEHLFFGKLGHLFVILAFVSSLLAAFSYYYATKDNEIAPGWKSIARKAFGLHAFSVLGIVLVLFYLIYQHYFEYFYVWEHSSKALPLRYILACFWEGQEGSFLLWTFWHVFLSLFLIRKNNTWEAPVMAVISITQVFLTSMLLGIYVFDYKIGSNPFILLREHPEMSGMPFVSIADYLKKLDGRGLNPLLQNYWMVIHPPTLFLGFASTLIPFAYAMAGLWKKKYTEWVIPALPWTFFGVMILGTGILMGGAWAYEALSFGGFWAWDPVENASLVPWLTFVGAAHVMLINKTNGKSIITVLVLTVLTFLLILYSTFLTRSGILGDSSVHAFTDLGMSGQLLFYMGFFVILSIVLIIINWKSLPGTIEEESAYSREFWMFIGALVLVIACFQITFTTSIPVINKIFGSKLAPPVDVKAHYNAWQLPFAVLISGLMAVTQYLKWKTNQGYGFFKKLTVPFFIALVATLAIALGYRMQQIHYIALLFSSFFAITANLNYILVVLKGKATNWGASIAHTGFGFILLGILISTSQSTTISKNLSGFNLGKDFPNTENIMLMKGDTLPMGGYLVSFKGKEQKGVNIYYNIDYYTQEAKTGKPVMAFRLQPLIQTNPRMGNVSEPDTRHYLDKDIYTHITYANLDDLKDNHVHDSDYKAPVTKKVAIGDTISASNCLIIVKGINNKISPEALGELKETDIAVSAVLKIIDVNKKEYLSEPIMAIKGNMIYSKEALVGDLGLKIIFEKIQPENGKLQIQVAEKKSNSKEFIIMKAIVFPYINVLWMGALLMIIGTLLAVRQRILQRK